MYIAPNFMKFAIKQGCHLLNKLLINNVVIIKGTYYEHILNMPNNTYARNTVIVIYAA